MGEQLALNHYRPIIEGGPCAATAPHFGRIPRNWENEAVGRALVPPFVRRRQASVMPADVVSRRSPRQEATKQKFYEQNSPPLS